MLKIKCVSYCCSNFVALVVRFRLQQNLTVRLWFLWTCAETWKCFITTVLWLIVFAQCLSTTFPSLSSPLLHLLPSSQMQQRCYFACAFLFLLSSLLFPSLAHSLQCPATQYAWNDGSPNRCCDMCQPGKTTRSKQHSVLLFEKLNVDYRVHF